jgi:hypothetical protein
MKLLPWLKSSKECDSISDSIAAAECRPGDCAMREAYECRTFADRFYEFAYQCVREIYGPIKPGDFNSMSAMRGFVACKQNTIRCLIRKQRGSSR